MLSVERKKVSQTLGVVILAAGKGERLRIGVPKPLAPIAGRKLVDFPLSESLSFGEKVGLKTQVAAITGHRREELEKYLSTQYSGRVHFAFQREQKGTADALKAYFECRKKEAKEAAFTLVLCADTPLIREGDLEVLYRALQEGGSQAVAAVFRADNPHGYGRIVGSESGEGQGFHIVEEKEASEEVRKVTTVNSGVYFFRTPFLLERLGQIEARGGNEFYLTDIFQDDLPVRAVLFPNGPSFQGVNTLSQLQRAESCLRREIHRRHQENGVYIVDPRHTYIDWDVTIAPGAIVHPHCFIYGGTTIGPAAEIGPFCTIRDAEIGAYCHIKGHCHLEEAAVGEGAAVGPFAHLRPGSHIGKNSKIGNFVETKNAHLQAGVKVSHLSYVGDAEIGEGTNIGCGFITCNYDGTHKHKTTIGKNAFIGSDTQTVAPVSIGDGAYIGSGSTINRNVPDEAFAIARAKQVTKEGMAKKFKKSGKGK